MEERARVLKARVEEMKYSGPGGGHRRKMVDDHEEQLTSSGARLERSKAKHERLSKVLISVKAGVKHIQDKLEGLREEVNGQRIELTDETVVNVLYENEKVLLELLARIKASKDEDAIVAGVAKKAGFDDDEAAADAPAAAAAGSLVDDEEIMQARPFNQRIALPSGEDGLDAIEEGMDGDNFEDIGEEEELTRVAIKKASEQLSSANDRRAKKKSRGKRKKSRA